MNGNLFGDDLMPNGDGYNPEFCKRVHKEVDRRLDKCEAEYHETRECLNRSLERVHVRVDTFNNKLNYVIVFLVANFVGALITIITTMRAG